MINLLEINNDTSNSAKIHESFIVCYILNRLCIGSQNATCQKYRTHFPKKSIRYNPDTFDFLVDFIVKNILTIISGVPSELKRINTKFSKELDELLQVIYSGESTSEITSKRSETIRDLKSIIDYKGFFLKLEPSDDYSAYHLAKNIGVRTCVHCNRVFALTHNTKFKEKLMRPQLDHWFPKSKYPLLALSFYNLVPSCGTCNGSVKGNDDMDLDIYIHPYVKQPKDDDFNFNYFYKNSIAEYEVLIEKTGKGTKHKDTLEFLKINEMYDAHQYELDDLVKLSQAYSTEYLSKLKSSFPEANLTEDEVYRLAFGTELNEKNFHKRPMSKFKYDILKALGVIKK